MNLDLEDIYKRKSIHDLLDFFIYWSESSIPVSDEEFNTKSEIEKNVYLMYEKLFFRKKPQALFSLIQKSVNVDIVKDFDIKSDDPTLEVILNYKFQDFRPRIKYRDECNLSCYNRVLFMLPEYEIIMDNFIPDLPFLVELHLLNTKKEKPKFHHKDLTRENFLSGFYRYIHNITKISIIQDLTCAIVLDRSSRRLFCKHPIRKLWLPERFLKLPAQDYVFSDTFGAIDWRFI